MYHMYLYYEVKYIYFILLMLDVTQPFSNLRRHGCWFLWHQMTDDDVTAPQNPADHSNTVFHYLCYFRLQGDQRVTRCFITCVTFVSRETRGLHGVPLPVLLSSPGRPEGYTVFHYLCYFLLQGHQWVRRCSITGVTFILRETRSYRYRCYLTSP